MEEDDQQRRQYEQCPAGRGFGQPHRGRSGSGVSDRFRHPQVTAVRSPTYAPRTSTGGQSQGVGSYGYTQGQQQYAPQLQESSLQYPADFAPEAQRQAQFPPYPSNLMYNIPSQVQQQSPYDPVQVPVPVQQYQSRPSAVIESQFAVPQFYGTNEPTTASGPLPPQYASTAFQQQLAYQQPQQPQQSVAAGRSSLSSAYSTVMPEYAQPAEPLEPSVASQEASGYDTFYSNYQTALRQTNQDTRDGKLIEAGQSVLEISEWLLGHAGDLGLTRDNQELHAERLKLWDEFNKCWLSVLQRQKDMTQEMIDSGQPLPPAHSILQEDFLEKMGKELVRLCDGMERHGLVDYQMGVWEEEIISVLTDCLDLLEGDEDDDIPPPRPTQGSTRSLGSGAR